MEDENYPQDLQIDIERDFKNIGDHKLYRGSACVTVYGEYDLHFTEGDSVPWQVEIRRISGGVSVKGSIAGSITLVCHRCLEDFTYRFELEIDEHAIMRETSTARSRDLEEYSVSGGVLDLEPIFRDAICLSFPTKRICSDSCKGICPSCGENLNTGNCKCRLKTSL